MTKLTRYQGPGKFEGELALAQVAYDAVLDGGSVYDALGCSVLEGPLVPSAEQIKEYGLTADDVAFGASLAGVGLFEDYNGFVYATWCETKAAFDSLVEELEAADIEDREDDEDYDDSGWEVFSDR